MKKDWPHCTHSGDKPKKPSGVVVCDVTISISAYSEGGAYRPPAGTGYRVLFFLETLEEKKKKKEKYIFFLQCGELFVGTRELDGQMAARLCEERGEIRLGRGRWAAFGTVEYRAWASLATLQADFFVVLGADTGRIKNKNLPGG